MIARWRCRWWKYYAIVLNMLRECGGRCDDGSDMEGAGCADTVDVDIEKVESKLVEDCVDGGWMEHWLMCRRHWRILAG